MFNILLQVDVIDVTRTLLVTREIEEHANVFHALTDLLNVYISLWMLGWLEEPRQVVLLDNHPAAALDSLWAAVAASGGIEALSAPWNATRKSDRYGPSGNSLAQYLVCRVVYMALCNE